jgi:hypothetical protein
MLAQTGFLHLKSASVRLQFFRYPEGTLSFPVGKLWWVKQKLWLETRGGFRRSLWLSCERAFLLYVFLHKLVLSEKQGEFYIADDVSVLRVEELEEKRRGVVKFVMESKDGMYSGEVLLDWDDVLAFMSFLKAQAVFCVFVAGQYEHLGLQRWKDHFFILHPIPIRIPTEKVKRAERLLKGEVQKPVVFKDLYSLKFVPQEGILFTTPNENIKLSQEQIQKLSLFFE